MGLDRDWPGGVGRLLLGLFVGPGLRGGRSRSFWYVRIAFWLIIIGITLYFGFAKHMWVSTCSGDCSGGD